MFTLTYPLIPCDLSGFYGVIYIFKMHEQSQKKKSCFTVFWDITRKKNLSIKAAAEEVCTIEEASVIQQNTPLFDSGVSTMEIWALQINPD